MRVRLSLPTLLGMRDGTEWQMFYGDAKYMGVQAWVMWAKKGHHGALDLKHLGSKGT